MPRTPEQARAFVYAFNFICGAVGRICRANALTGDVTFVDSLARSGRIVMRLESCFVGRRVEVTEWFDAAALLPYLMSPNDRVIAERNAERLLRWAVEDFAFESRAYFRSKLWC